MTLQVYFSVYLVITSIIPCLDEVLNLKYQKQLLLFSKVMQKVTKKLIYGNIKTSNYMF